jgi:transcription antitermination factor NusG
VPLFPGYLFLLANDDERLVALSTRHIARSFGATDQDRLWRDLHQVQQLLECGLPIAPVERLTEGCKVRIRRGPLIGLEGTILRGASGNRFVIQVNFIQRGASVLLDDDAVEQIN